MEPYFITFADLPPSPFDDERIEWYKELCNTFLLTEDSVKFIKDGKVSDEYFSALENLEKHGLNVFVRNMYNDPDYFDCPNDKSSVNYGAPYSLPARKVTDEFRTCGSVTGFYMADEPFMKEFAFHKEYANLDSLTKLVDWKNRYYPNSFFHMNMVPSESYDHYFFADKDGKPLDYEDFIKYYIDTIVRRLNGGGRSVCLDNYPFVYKDYLTPYYLNDLLTVSNLTRDYNDSCKPGEEARFGICVQTFSANCQTDASIKRDIVSESEVTFQLYVGIALGARLFEYFCFRSYPETAGAILDKDGNKRIFDLVKSANEKALPLGEKLDGSRYLGACYFRGENPYIAYRVYISKERFIAVPEILKAVKVSSDVLCGCFTSEDKDTFVFVNFSDPIQKRAVESSVNLNGVHTIRIYHNGQETEPANTDRFDIKLEPGDAALIEVSK